MASYWRNQPLAGRLRAIRLTFVGYVYYFDYYYELLSNEVLSNYCKHVSLFYAKFWLDCFCDFVLQHSLTSQVTCLRLSSSFLCNPNCCHSEVNFFANVKAIVRASHKSRIAESLMLPKCLIADWLTLGLEFRKPEEKISRLQLMSLFAPPVVREQFVRR